MKIIAHRGLLEGPNKELENRPDQIEHALALGFDVEVDVWFSMEPDPVRGGNYHVPTWWTGHDGPQYRVSQSFLEREGLWLHAKNAQAVRRMTPSMHWFSHDQDDYTLTSQGIVWCHPRSEVFWDKPSVIVLPETHVAESENIGEILAGYYDREYCYMCTDYGLTMQAAALEARKNPLGKFEL